MFVFFILGLLREELLLLFVILGLVPHEGNIIFLLFDLSIKIICALIECVNINREMVIGRRGSIDDE